MINQTIKNKLRKKEKTSLLQYILAIYYKFATLCLTKHLKTITKMTSCWLSQTVFKLVVSGIEFNHPDDKIRNHNQTIKTTQTDLILCFSSDHMKEFLFLVS